MERAESGRDEHLAELREQGLLPYSVVSTRALAFIGCIFSLHLITGYWRDFLSSLLTCIEAGPDVVLVSRMLSQLFYLLLLPALCIALFALLGRVLQLRFFWQFERLSPRLSNLSPFRSINIASKFQRAIWASFTSFVALAFCLSVSLLLLPEILALSTELNSAKGLLEAVAIFVDRLSYGFAFMCLILAVFGRLLESWLFRRRHRVSDK